MGAGGYVPLPPGDDSECTCGRRWPQSHLAVDWPATPVVEEHRYSMLGPSSHEIGSFQSDEGGDPLAWISDLGAPSLILKASPSESVAPVLSVPPDAVGEDSASSSSAVRCEFFFEWACLFSSRFDRMGRYHCCFTGWQLDLCIHGRVF